MIFFWEQKELLKWNIVDTAFKFNWYNWHWLDMLITMKNAFLSNLQLGKLKNFVILMPNQRCILGDTNRSEILFEFFTIQFWKVNSKPVIIPKLFNYSVFPFKSKKGWNDYIIFEWVFILGILNKGFSIKC